MKAPTTVLAALKAARKTIEQKGWCQGSFSNSAGEVCALGAIREVTEDNYPLQHEAGKELQLALRGRKYCMAGGSHHSTCQVAAYNDRANRKKDDILCLYDRAIERVRARRGRATA